MENEDVAQESSSLQEPSFFGSLAGGSLAPSSLGAAVSDRPVLCRAALGDQHKALDKCACSHDDAQVEREENNNKAKHWDVSLSSKPGLLNADDPVAQLSCLSAVHATKSKTVDDSLPVPVPVCLSPETAGACSSGRHMPACSAAPPKLDNPAQPQVDSSSWSVDEERGGDDGFKMVGGLSKESRNSTHNKAGEGPHSTQC